MSDKKNNEIIEEVYDKVCDEVHAFDFNRAIRLAVDRSLQQISSEGEIVKISFVEIIPIFTDDTYYSVIHIGYLLIDETRMKFYREKKFPLLKPIRISLKENDHDPN